MVRMDDPFDDNGTIADHERRLRALERAPQIGFTAVDSGALTVKSAEGLIVQGSARTTGSQSVDGVLYVDGHLRVNGDSIYTGPVSFTGAFSNVGTFTNTGKLVQNGDADLNGNTRIQGNTTISGTTELQSDLNVTGGGKIQAGAVVIDGTSGGRVAAPGGTLALVGTQITFTGAVTANNGVLVNGPFVALGSKSFGMEHPDKPGVMLLHGATESPVSGIEYWGDGALNDDGDATVRLPDYFDALAKPDGRTVFVTGRGHSPDWSDVDGNTFTVTGSPGGRFSWLVKAERFGGDFDLEQPMPELSEPLEA